MAADEKTNSKNHGSTSRESLTRDARMSRARVERENAHQNKPRPKAAWEKRQGLDGYTGAATVVRTPKKKK